MVQARHRRRCRTRAGEFRLRSTRHCRTVGESPRSTCALLKNGNRSCRKMFFIVGGIRHWTLCFIWGADVLIGSAFVGNSPRSSSRQIRSRLCSPQQLFAAWRMDVGHVAVFGCRYCDIDRTNPTISRHGPKTLGERKIHQIRASSIHEITTCRVSQALHSMRIVCRNIGTSIRASAMAQTAFTIRQSNCMTWMVVA